MEFPPNLTERERDVLPHLISGQKRRDIAMSLGISEDTVKRHVKHILAKFQVASLRDGFDRMNDYQTYYGKNGLGFETFINSSLCLNEVQENRVDCVQTVTTRFTSMVEGLQSYTVSFPDYMRPGQISGDYYVSKQIDGVERTWSIKCDFDPPLRRHQVFETQYQIELFNAFPHENKNDIIYFELPYARREVVFSFLPNDAPHDITHRVVAGLEQVLPSTFTATYANGRYSMVSFDGRGASQLHISWSYHG